MVLRGDTETFMSSASYQPPSARGSFNVTDSKTVEWTGVEEEPEEGFMKVTMWEMGQPVGNFPACYSDGWRRITMVADVPASKAAGFNFFDDPDVWRDLVGTRAAIPGNPPPAPREISVKSKSSRANTPGRDMRFYAERPLDPDTGTPIGETDEEGAYGWAAVTISNCSELPPPDPNCNLPCCFPPCEEVEIRGSFKPPGSYLRGFAGCVAESESGCKVPNESGGFDYAFPGITWTNPLKGRMWIDGRIASGPFDVARDGVTTHEMWVELKFSGEPLPLVARRHNVLDPSGSPMPMPQARFDVYFLDQEWDALGELVKSNKLYDSTLTVSDATPTVHVCRTTTSQGHYHSCEVDDVTGDGSTTGTFLANSVTPSPDDHVHQVAAFEFSDASGTDGATHSHSPMSVAVTRLNPVSNGTLNVCMEATVSYDASRTPVARTKSFKACTQLEWFDFWEMTLGVPNIVGVEPDVTDDNGGVTVAATLRHKVNGAYVPVDDGIRINFDVKAYVPQQDGEDDEGMGVPTFDASETQTRWYSAVEVTATARIAGRTYVQYATFYYQSVLQWSPAVKPLVDGPTDDAVYVSDALDNVSSVKGASMLYDAIVLAADRINLHRLDNPEWSGSDKIVFVLSDWCENLSQRTLAQVRGRLALLSADGRKAFLAVMLFGGRSRCDALLANKAVSDSSGGLVPVPMGCDPLDVPGLVSELFTLGMDSFNSGSYTGTVDVGGGGGSGGQTTSALASDAGRFTSVYVDIFVPPGATATFSARFSSDRETWTAWTEPITITGPVSVPMDSGQCRYMQYIVRMVGNSSFESPRLSGVTATYLRPSTDVVFLQPIAVDEPSDEFVGEAVVTHEASIPENASVRYGATCHDTTDASHYAWGAKPWFSANERSVTLTRFNEPTMRVSNRAYVATNGGWPLGSYVEVYVLGPGETDGVLADPATYSLNPATGGVTFASPLEPDSRVIIDVRPDKTLRMAIRMVNGSTTPIEIGGLTVMFNGTKRVRRAPDGMIVRHPMGYELDDSSSSSSSLSSASSSQS
jgi:hypothetical protein